MKSGTLLVATKGLADAENINILFMKGDIIIFIQKEDDDGYLFDVVEGAMEGLLINLKAKSVVEYFEYYKDEAKQ